MQLSKHKRINIIKEISKKNKKAIMAEMHEDTGLQIHIDPYGKRHPLLDAWDTAEKIKSNNKKKIALCHSIAFTSKSNSNDQTTIKVDPQLILRDSEEHMPYGMLILTRFISLFRVFTLEISLHREIDHDFVNGCLFACIHLFKRKIYGDRLIKEFLNACNIRIILPFFQIAPISANAIQILAIISENHYNGLVHNVQELQLFVNAIKQIKNENANLAVDTMINFGRPMINNKLLNAAMQGLNELLDASAVLNSRIAAAEIIAKRIFCLKVKQQEKEEMEVNNKETTKKKTSFRFDQSKLSTSVIYGAVALLKDFRTNDHAIYAAFTMLDNILKYAENEDIRTEFGKQMLPNLLTLMRNHASSDPNKHWRDIHEKPKTAQDAGIGLLVDLLKIIGPSMGDKNRVVFAIISSMTHVDEYTVQVAAVKILQMMLASPLEWKVSSMAIRLILPVNLMKSLEHLVRYMKRQDEKDDNNDNDNNKNTQQNATNKINNTPGLPIQNIQTPPPSVTPKTKKKLWKKFSQLATTSVISEDGTRITSTLAEIRTFLTKELTLEMVHQIRKNLTEYGWTPESIRPVTPPNRGTALLRTIRMFGGHGHGMIRRRKKKGKGKDDNKRITLTRSSNAILQRLQRLEKEQEEEKTKEKNGVVKDHDQPIILPVTVENVIKEVQGKLIDPNKNRDHEHHHHKHQFIPLNIPSEVPYGNSHEIGLHDLAFIQRANLSEKSNSRNAQAGEGLGQALSWSNATAASIARAVLEREDATRAVREKADDKMAAKFGASFDAADERPPAEKILQDRVDQGMVMLMMQQNHRKSGAAKNHILHGPKLKMTSESMVKHMINNNANNNALRVSKPSPRSQEMLKDYCRGVYIEPNPKKGEDYYDDMDGTEGILNTDEKETIENYKINTDMYFRQYMKTQRRHFKQQMKEANFGDNSRSGSRSSKSGSSTRSSSRVTNTSSKRW